eukprot:TRINITY_DN55873_c0_g1_i1.p1 TRINITY_DN55873_c0_g1~~TRINITY_DN55873_c0_g1_i1.p1  ORF type:complete len:237 (-),score=51.39 TRINITY_DN55873_c0_g1_i1:317-1027(-)
MCIRDRCSEAMAGRSEWMTPAGEARESHAMVWCGTYPGNDLVSVSWSVDFESSPELSDLLRDMFQSHSMGSHAEHWDETYTLATVLAEENEVDRMLVRRMFDAQCLGSREMLYVIANRTAPAAEGGEQVVYGYPSVSDQEAMEMFGVTVPREDRIRSENVFPSCDAVTTLPNGKTRVTHLITSRLNGCVSACCFNVCFKSPMIGASKDEVDAFVRHVKSQVHSGGSGAEDFVHVVD